MLILKDSIEVKATTMVPMQLTSYIPFAVTIEAFRMKS